MSTDNTQHTDPRTDPQRLVPTPADQALSVPREHRDPAVEASTTPEAVRAAQVARDQKQHAAVVRGRGVEWVRPTDLMARHSANVAGPPPLPHTASGRDTGGSRSCAAPADNHSVRSPQRDDLRPDAAWSRDRVRVAGHGPDGTRSGNGGAFVGTGAHLPARRCRHHDHNHQPQHRDLA